MNEDKAPQQAVFSSCMTRSETIAVLLYLPIHLGLLPLLLLRLPETASLSELQINTIIYTAGTLWMLLFAGRFLRRDFDPLCDHPAYCLLQVLLGYGMMLAFNMLIAAFFQFLLPEAGNPNNAAWAGEMESELGKTAALAVFLAPLVEEPIFRGGIFSLFYKRNRGLAYAVSMLLFSLYHVWAYAILDPRNWVYLLQYLPASWVLCRCYERCNSIWGSIFLHMSINGISVLAISAVQGMM